MALRKHLPPQQVEFLQKLMLSAYETFTEHLVCARDRFVDFGGGFSVGKLVCKIETGFGQTCDGWY